MKTLWIRTLQPNPYNKTRSALLPANQELFACIYLTNPGMWSRNLKGLQLRNDQYRDRGPLFTFPQLVVEPGQMLAILFGIQPLGFQMQAAGQTAVEQFIFTGRDELEWGVTRGDTVSLWDSNGKWIDPASYDPNLREGEVLHRSGSKLVSTAPMYFRRIA